MIICEDFEQLKKDLESKEIILFGAGKRLFHVIDFLKAITDKTKIRCIVDNDSAKNKKTIQYDNSEYDVCSVEILKSSLANRNICIVITTLMYIDILKQLSEIIEYDVNVYVETIIETNRKEFEALNRSLPSDLKRGPIQLIPKVINYCWFGGGEIPYQNRVWMESWEKYCPDYKIVKWDEKNYDISKNEYMCQAYKEKKWGFVPDFARLDIIYSNGGIYLDTDVEIIQPLDELLYQSAYAGFEDDTYVGLGLGFGAQKGNEIIKYMMNEYEQIKFCDEGKLNLTPSPVIQTETLKKIGLCANGEYQVIQDKLTIYPEKVLTGKGGGAREIVLAPYTKSIHHYDASWASKEYRESMMKRRKELQLYNNIREAGRK